MTFGAHLLKLVRELWLPLLVTIAGTAAFLALSDRLYQPIPAVGEATGVLVSDLRADELLAAALRDSAPGHAITVFSGDAEILARGQAEHVVHAPTPEPHRPS
jgi:hypothetical protein